MTHVSKQILKQKHFKELTVQFTELFVGSNGETAQYIFSDLFTPAEQIMFVKRLALIIMINKGYSGYRIAKTLKVSESTVKNIWNKYDSGAYDGLLKIIRSKKFDSEKFWSTVEILLRLGMPPMGRGRWKGILK